MGRTSIYITGCLDSRYICIGRIDHSVHHSVLVCVMAESILWIQTNRIVGSLLLRFVDYSWSNSEILSRLLVDIGSRILEHQVMDYATLVWLSDTNSFGSPSCRGIVWSRLSVVILSLMRKRTCNIKVTSVKWSWYAADRQKNFIWLIAMLMLIELLCVGGFYGSVFI